MSLRTLLTSVKREKFIVPNREQMEIRERIADRLEEDLREMQQKGFSYYLENIPQHFDLVVGRITWLQAIFGPKSISFLLKSVKVGQREKAQDLLYDFRADLTTVFEDDIRRINFFDIKHYLVKVLELKALHEDRKKVFENHVGKMTEQLARMLRNKDIQFANHIINSLRKSTQV